MKVLIVGFGVSGKAAAKLAAHQGYEVLITDKKKQEVSPPYTFIEESNLNLIQQLDFAIVSPGIRDDNEGIQKLKTKGVKIISEVEFGLQHLNQRIIAITGSNGKTTTVLFVKHLLETAGQKACALGNIGRAVCEYALRPNPEEVLVLELSSFQLERLNKPWFDLVALINIQPDHLDAYPSYLAYAQAKLGIFHCLKKDGIGLICKKAAAEFAFEPFHGSIQQIEMESQKNLYYALGAQLNISKEVIETSMNTFNKPSHRQEYVTEISGVTFFNDSKATNLKAMLYALSEIDREIHLIAGGRFKGEDFATVKEALPKNLKTIYALGEMQQNIEISLNKQVNVVKVGSLKEAVQLAFAQAKPSEVVLLSPGCPSFDQFKNFEERGEMFKSIVQQLKVGKAL